MNFGEAITALKLGKMVARSTWANETFVFMQIPSEIGVLHVVPKMQSLPDSVKDEFTRRLLENKTSQTIQYKDQLAKVSNENTVVGWSAGSEDILAEDWCDYNKGILSSVRSGMYGELPTLSVGEFAIAPMSNRPGEDTLWIEKTSEEGTQVSVKRFEEFLSDFFDEVM